MDNIMGNFPRTTILSLWETMTDIATKLGSFTKKSQVVPLIYFQKVNKQERKE